MSVTQNFIDGLKTEAQELRALIAEKQQERDAFDYSIFNAPYNGGDTLYNQYKSLKSLGVPGNNPIITLYKNRVNKRDNMDKALSELRTQLTDLEDDIATFTASLSEAVGKGMDGQTAAEIATEETQQYIQDKQSDRNQEKVIFYGGIGLGTVIVIILLIWLGKKLI